MEIAAGGHQVVVEAPEPLDRVAATAMRVWMATDSPGLVLGFGFAAVTSDTTVVGPPAEVTLPRRMTEGYE